MSGATEKIQGKLARRADVVKISAMLQCWLAGHELILAGHNLFKNKDFSGALEPYEAAMDLIDADDEPALKSLLISRIAYCKAQLSNGKAQSRVAAAPPSYRYPSMDGSEVKADGATSAEYKECARKMALEVVAKPIKVGGVLKPLFRALFR